MRGMAQSDDITELEWLNENDNTPLHAHMGLRILVYGPHTIVTMELSEAVRGQAEGSVHGGMLPHWLTWPPQLPYWERTTLTMR